MKNFIFVSIVKYFIFVSLVFTTTGNHAFAKPAECKNYPIGQNQVLALHSGRSVGSAQFSPDGNSVVTTSDDDTAIVYNLKTKESQKIQHSGQVYSAQFSPDGNSVVTASEDATAIVYNLKTKESQKIQHSNRVNSAQFSPDGNSVVTASDDGTAIVYNLKTKESRQIQHSGLVYSAQFSPDGNSVVTASEDATALVYNLKTKESQKIQHSGLVYSAQFSPDGNSVVTASRDGTSIVYNLKTKEFQKVRLSGLVRSAQFSPDGNSVLTTSTNGKVVIYNLRTKEFQRHDRSALVNSAKFSPDGNSIVTASGDGTAIVYNLQTMESQTIQHPDWVHSAQFSPDGRSVMTRSYDGNIRITALIKTCANASLEVASSKLAKDPQLCIKCQATDDNLADQAQLLTEASVEAFCQKDFAESDWEKVTPKVDLSQGSISEKTAMMYLLRFQKAGGFEPKAHLPILLGILKSDLVNQKPELISNAMANVLSVSNQLFESLLAEFPNLRNTDVKAQSPHKSKGKSKLDLCENEKDKKTFAEGATEYIKYKKATNPKRAKMSDWQNLGALSHVLTQLPEIQKEGALYDIAYSLADGAADDSQYRGIFYSKLFQFTKRAAMPWFGLASEDKPLTDLTLVRERDRIKPLLMGEAPLRTKEDAKTATKTNPQTDYGFFVQKLSEIQVPSNPQPGDKLNDSTIQWEMKGKPYSANLKIHVGDKNKVLIPEGASPKYEELKRGDGLVGVVMTGTSLGSNQAGSTMNEYLAYYEKEGFEFAKEPQKIANIMGFLKPKVESGELKYMIKEAHSDGDDKNLFRMNTQANMLVGINKKTKEKVYLAFPTAGDNSSTLLSNAEFGQWIRDREQKGGGQFVYFNTSCGSYAKAIHEIEATQSPLLLNIPTKNTTSTFTTHETSTERLLFTAFRNGKNYEEIRGELEKSEKYKNKRGDGFMFPDEDDYKAYVTRVLATPLKIDTHMTTDNGRPYQFDQNVH